MSNISSGEKNNGYIKLPDFSASAGHLHRLLANSLLALASAMPLDDVLNSITSYLHQELPCDVAMLILADNGPNDGHVLSQQGWDSGLSPLLFSTNDLALIKEAAFFSVPTNFLAAPISSSSTFRLQQATSGFCVSVLVAGQPYAILMILNRQTPQRLESQDVIKLMLTLSDALANRFLLANHLDQLSKERDEAVNSNESKTYFLARISHEIRTPMNGVIGMLEILRETHLDTKQQEYISLAKKSAESMVDLIGRFLDLAKIETGKLQLEEIVFPLPKMLEQTVELFKNRALQKNIAFISDVSEMAPCYVLGDPTRLNQIIVNLLGNALKFTHQGHIMFKTRCESIEKNQIILTGEVIDTGIGIPLAMHDAIFESFSQADQSISRIYGGTGLGLSICRQLVGLMGGEVAVAKSILGEGTTIRFSVNLKEARPPAGGEAELDLEKSGTKKALLIGDDLLEGDLSKWLCEFDFTVVSASTGMEALGLLNSCSEQPYAIFVGKQLHTIRQDQLLGVLHKMISPAVTRLIAIQADSASSNKSFSLQYTILPLPIDKGELLATLTMPAPVHDVPTAITSVPAPSVASPENLPAQHDYLILVAEDNPVNRKVTMNTLSKLGYQAKVVENGALAVDANSQQSFDLILMDCQMPVMDGYQATAEIRRREQAQEKHTPIVAITAHAMEGDRQKCLDAGMDDYLSKPIRLTLLQEMIEKWLGKAPSNED